MEVLELEGRRLYRPKKGCKVKFQNDHRTYSEIVVGLNDNRIVEEIKIKKEVKA